MFPAMDASGALVAWWRCAPYLALYSRQGYPREGIEKVPWNLIRMTPA
jgi:hypothetical protein